MLHYHYHYWYFKDKQFQNWDPEVFDWSYSAHLVIYCTEYIHIWWDADKFDWRYFKLLLRHCTKYKSVWHEDYIIYKLKQ